MNFFKISEFFVKLRFFFSILRIFKQKKWNKLLGRISNLSVELSMRVIYQLPCTAASCIDDKKSIKEQYLLLGRIVAPISADSAQRLIHQGPYLRPCAT